MSSHSSLARSILPRVAGTLDATAVSDVTTVEHDTDDGSTTFTRPIYAGNALATVKLKKQKVPAFFTVRSTAFNAAATSESEADVQALEPVEPTDLKVEHIRTELTKSDRPELGAASRVVSGGRALKDAKTFKDHCSKIR